MRLERVFVVGGKELKDPAPTVGDISTLKKLLSSENPEVLNCSHIITIKDNKERYEFSAAKVGTHG
jgi:PRTRC genetic system protein C